jgi:hypothetical protein
MGVVLSWLCIWRFCNENRVDGMGDLFVSADKPKPKFRVGQRVRFKDRQDSGFIAKLVKRDDALPKVWHWRIEGFCTGTSPENLIRPLTKREKGDRR